MSRNTLLSTANFFCQFFKSLMGISIILITVIFIHFQIDRDFYNEWEFEQKKNPSMILIETESYVYPRTGNDVNLHFSNLNTGSLYFNYFKFSAIFILLYLSINEFRKVLISVEKLESFHQTNVSAFKNIGSYCFIIFGISIFSYWGFDDYAKSSISIHLYILLIALIAFILAEVFKEGNNLLEENQLTI